VSADEPGHDAPQGRSTRSILSAVKDNVQGLIAHELAAAKRELVDGVKQQLSGAVLFLAAAVMALPLLLFIGTAAALGLSTVMPDWAAFLTVAGVFAALILILVLVGKKRLATTPQPTQTIAETKTVVQTLSRAVNRPETDR
jgi:branched-subunit amino acid transport protein